MMNYSLLTTASNILISIKCVVLPKLKILKFFTLKLLQTCMNFFVLLNTKEDILKNEGNRTFVGPH